VSDKWTVNSVQTKDDLIKHIESMFEQKKYLTIDIKAGKPRTNQQNNALHLYLSRLATALNDSGQDMRRTIKQDVDIPWTADLCKEYMWKPIQKALYGVDSTTKPKSDQYSNIYETLNRHTSGKLGVGIQWPVRDK